MSKDLVSLGIWVVIVGGAFAYLWRKGHLLSIRNYVSETREELRKCTWPTWDELRGNTVVVTISIVLLGLLTVVLDFVILKFIRAILPTL